MDPEMISHIIFQIVTLQECKSYARIALDCDSETYLQIFALGSLSPASSPFVLPQSHCHHKVNDLP